MCISLSLFLSLSLYIYIYMHICVYIYIYIYIYTHIQRVLLIVEGMTLLQTLQDFATPSGLTGSIWKTELEQIQKRKPGETAKLQFNLESWAQPHGSSETQRGHFQVRLLSGSGITPSLARWQLS